MMAVEMVCTCEAMIELTSDESEDHTPIWYMIYRFADAHVNCGYLTAPKKDKPEAAEADVESESS